MIRADIIQRLALGSLEAVRMNPSFPYRTGHLKYAATYTDTSMPNQFTIVFDLNIAPYIKYLDRGVSAHQFINKYGTLVRSGGQSKHVGFIERSKEDVIGYLAVQFRSQGHYVVKRGNRKGYGQ